MSFNMWLSIVLSFLCIQTFAPIVIALGLRPLRCRKDTDCPPPEICTPRQGPSVWEVYEKYGVCRCPEGYAKHRCGFCKETSGCGSSCAPPNKCLNNKCRCLEGLGFIKNKWSGKCIDTCPDCSFPSYCKYNNVLNKRECVCPDGTTITDSGCRSSCQEGDGYPCHHSAKCFPTRNGPQCICPAQTVGDPWNKIGSGCQNICWRCRRKQSTCLIMKKIVTDIKYLMTSKCVCKESFMENRTGDCVSRCGLDCNWPKTCIFINGNYSCVCRPDKFNITPVNGKCVDKCGNSCSSGKKCKDWLIGSGRFACRCPCERKFVRGKCQRRCRNCRQLLKTCKLDPSNLPRKTYRCVCKDGYKEVTPPIHGKSKQTYCVDKDECEEWKQCDGGKCTNTIGSFYCTCKRGEMAYEMYNRNTSSIIRVCDKYSPWDKNWKPTPI